MIPPASEQSPCDECAKTRLDRELAAEEAERAHRREVEKAEAAALVALQKAERDAEHELAKLFHETLAEVSKGSIDRSRDSAKYVQSAAAGIGTLYSGVLALVFSVTDHPLPWRGVWATVFLGLAIALATAYLAFLTKPTAPPMYGGGNSLGDLQFQRTGWLTKWVNSTVLNRRWAIRASVLSLAFGVVFLVAPFVSSTRSGAVPPAPVAPEIPGEVAPAVESQATRLFQIRVDEFEAATKAREDALSQQGAAAAEARADEQRVNDYFRNAALGALAFTLLGPGLWSLKEKHWRSGSCATSAATEAAVTR